MRYGTTIDPKVVLNDIKELKEANGRLDLLSKQLPSIDDIKDGQIVDFLMKNGNLMTATVFRNMISFVVVRMDGKGEGIWLAKKDIVSIDIS